MNTNNLLPHRFYTPRRRPIGKAMALVGVMLALMLILASGLIGFAKMNAGSTSGGVGSTSSNTLLMAKTRMNIVQAENLADTGLRTGVQWISELGSPPINTAAFTPLMVTPSDFYYNSGPVDQNKWTVVNFAPDPAKPTEGKFKIRFYPHSDNAVASQRSYLIESIGEYNGVVRVARADIRQKNFAQYAYFTDDVGAGFWVSGRTTFNGPVHINNSNGADINIVWDSVVLDPNKSQIFQWNGDNAFTMWSKGGTNAAKVKWQKDSIGSFANPTSDADWKNTIKPATDGTKRIGPSLTADKVEMPVGEGTLKSFDQRNAALGGFDESTVPAGNGVYVPSEGGVNQSSGVVTGGVYIKGVVNDMVLEAGGVGNRDQIVYIYQNNDRTKWKLTMTASGSTKLERFTRANTSTAFSSTNTTGYPRNYTGATNGVIYSFDDIGVWDGTGGVSGTVANSPLDAEGNATQLAKLSIATRVDTTGNGNQKTINIDGNVLYANANKDASQAPFDSGVLGLVAGYVRIKQNAKVVEPAVTGFANRAIPNDGFYANNAILKDLSVHATVMSYNTIQVDNHDTREKGQFYLLGGYIAKTGSPFGTTLGGSDPLTMFNQRNGFQRILNYDKRAATQPPPYFPGTGQAYEVISYQRLLAPLQP